jgi:hypothetical protein
MKTGVNSAGESETFYGIRLYLKSALELHHTEDDDDRSAVTFWMPRSVTNRHKVGQQFLTMASLIAEVLIRVTDNNEFPPLSEVIS